MFSQEPPRYQGQLTPVAGEEAVPANQADGLRIGFWWKHDRFIHCIGEPKDGIVCDWITRHDDPWPYSPPLQEVSPEVIDRETIFFGVGSAGTGHWSVSVRQDKSSTRGGWLFEWACRIGREVPEWLGIRYQQPANSKIQYHVETLSDSKLEISEDRQWIEITPLQLAGKTVVWSYRVGLR